MAKDYFTKLMQKGEVDDSYNMRGDKVASSRSRLGKRKDNSKLKPGVPAQHGTEQEKLFTEKIKRLFNLLEDTNANTTIARPKKLN